jgi:hypothetical protein
MGNYYFSLPDGSITKVEYTFGYFLDAEGRVRINLHHSSVPFSAGGAALTEEQVVAAQKAWSDGIVAISAAKANGGDYAQMAHDHIKNMYGYDQGPVLFKPTLAADAPFRPTFEGAFSYFVATNGLHAEDKGFAIKGWTAVRWENDKIVINGDTALAMGNYYFSLPDGSITKVEYTFGYFLDAEGRMRINLHHSSVPFQVPQSA